MSTTIIARQSDDNVPLAYEGKIIRFYHEDEAIAFLTSLGLDDGSYYVDYYAKISNREFINCVELAGRCYRSSMQ